MTKPDDTSTRSWDAVASDWVTHADNNDYRLYLLLPLTLKLLGDVAGLRVLDLGCGEGGYSRELTRRGAKVLGVDGSPKLIKVATARAAAEALDITYLCANAGNLDPIPSGSCDLILAAMSLMDVENYAGAIEEAWRILLPGGRLLMSITHPCFSAPVSEWIKTESGERRYFAVDRYLDRTAWESFITARFEKPVIRRHQPLEDFTAPLLRAGFLLRMFHEPTATPEQIEKSPRLGYLARIPYFLFMLWQKPS